MNLMKTTVLLAALTGLLVLVGDLIGGPSGAVLFLVLAGAMNFFAYWYSDKMALKMAGAHEVTESQEPGLFAIVRNVARLSGMPMPRVYVIETDSPNAFATGRNPAHGVVCVTHGILQTLDRDELAGVIAHELSHIKNRDMLIGTVAAVVAGAIGMIAHLALFFGGGRRNDGEGNPLVGLLLLILAPIAATLIQLAVSRSREYEADRSAAELTGNPNGLASALGKLTAGSQRRPLPVADSMASLFIVTPLTGRSVSALFMTHPPIEKRIARLRSMPQNM